jgi:NitT/TauT family transport system permease protein
VVIGLIGLLIDIGLKWISKRLTPWADQTRH